eukprot:512122_1
METENTYTKYSKKCMNLIKQHPILSACSILTVTSGAILATWVIGNINKAVSLQSHIHGIDYEYDDDFEMKQHIDEKKEEDNNIEIIHNSTTTSGNEKIRIRVPHYRGPNPFIIKPLSLYSKCKIYFFCMNGIVYIRLCSLILTATGMYILSIPPKKK